MERVEVTEGVRSLPSPGGSAPFNVCPCLSTFKVNVCTIASSCYSVFMVFNDASFGNMYHFPCSLYKCLWAPACSCCVQCWKCTDMVLGTGGLAQSCRTLCDPVEGSVPGSAVHGIFLARILEWVAISFSRGSSQPRDWTQVSCIADRCFTVWATPLIYDFHGIMVFARPSGYSFSAFKEPIPSTSSFSIGSHELHCSLSLHTLPWATEFTPGVLNTTLSRWLPILYFYIRPL